MAERSFVKEVEKLRLGAGEEFSGEGILAITKALLECGVGYVGGYQGAPISHLMDVLAGKALLAGADFTGANLYRADLSRVIGDARIGSGRPISTRATAGRAEPALADA